MVPWVTVRIVASRITVTPEDCARAAVGSTTESRSRDGDGCRSDGDGAAIAGSCWMDGAIHRATFACAVRAAPAFEESSGESSIAAREGLGWRRLIGRRLLVYWIPLAIDEHMLDFGFFAEQIAVGNHQVGDLAGLDAAEDIARTEYLRGVEGERTQRGIRGQSRVDRFFQVLADVFRPFETIGIKRELHSGFGEFRWGTRSAVTETQIAQGLLLFGIGIFAPWPAISG